MIKVKKSQERGHENRGWLDTYHTFSFGSYYDPKQMGFRSLRVINEDYIKLGKGFGAHAHEDMEIITYVLEGNLEHEDSLGNKGVIHANEVQRMSAGTGIVHSERNLSTHENVHLLQIWISPEHYGITPSYEQKMFSSASKWGQWCLIVSSNGRNGSIKIHQDADIYSTILDQDTEIIFQALSERYYWIQVIAGEFVIQNNTLNQGDGAAISDEMSIKLTCKQNGEILLFDLS